VFRERLGKLLDRLPDALFSDQDIQQAWLSALRRARRDDLYQPEPVWKCTCGHEHEWHRDGVECDACSCTLFEPATEKPVRKAQTPRSHQSDEGWFRWLDLPDETQEALRRADYEEYTHRKNAGAQRRPNPWDMQIAANDAQRRQNPTSLDDYPVGSVNRDTAPPPNPTRMQRQDSKREHQLEVKRELRRLLPKAPEQPTLRRRK
jgi:hypothetical protein